MGDNIRMNLEEIGINAGNWVDSGINAGNWVDSGINAGNWVDSVCCTFCES